MPISDPAARTIHCDTHDRRSTRLPGWDYSAEGDYFVTLCARDRSPIFGHLANGRIELTDIGRIVADAWRWLPSQYAYVVLDEWCLMPDHLHGIVRLVGCRGGSRTAPTWLADADTRPIDPGTRRKTLGRLIGAFKTVSTKRVNQWRQTAGLVVWQRGFFDRLVRDAIELERVRTYIRDNVHTDNTVSG